MNAYLQSSYLCLLVYITRKTLILSSEKHLFAVLASGSDSAPLDSTHLVHSTNIYCTFYMPSAVLGTRGQCVCVCRGQEYLTLLNVNGEARQTR